MGSGRLRCADGLDALARHDQNGDGRIDGADPVYGRLLLWQDKNRDGRSQPKELRGLDAAGIVALDLGGRLDLAWVDAAGNSAMRALDFTRADGSRGVMHDVWFGLRFDQMPQNPRTSGLTSTLLRR